MKKIISNSILAITDIYKQLELVLAITLIILHRKTILRLSWHLWYFTTQISYSCSKTSKNKKLPKNYQNIYKELKLVLPKINFLYSLSLVKNVFFIIKTCFSILKTKSKENSWCLLLMFKIFLKLNIDQTQ